MRSDSSTSSRKSVCYYSEYLHVLSICRHRAFIQFRHGDWPWMKQVAAHTELKCDNTCIIWLNTYEIWIQIDILFTVFFIHVHIYTLGKYMITYIVNYWNIINKENCGTRYSFRCLTTGPWTINENEYNYSCGWSWLALGNISVSGIAPITGTYYTEEFVYGQDNKAPSKWSILITYTALIITTNMYYHMIRYFINMDHMHISNYD